MSAFKTPAISRPGEGTQAFAFGHNTIRVPAVSTGGKLSIMEVAMGPGDRTPLHVHDREDEVFRVLSGKFGFWCGEAYEELEEDGIIALPRAVPHRIANIGDTEGKVMVVLTPGGFEEFFRAAAENVGGDPIVLGAQYGLAFLPE